MPRVSHGELTTLAAEAAEVLKIEGMKIGELRFGGIVGGAVHVEGGGAAGIEEAFCEIAE